MVHKIEHSRVEREKRSGRDRHKNQLVFEISWLTSTVLPIKCTTKFPDRKCNVKWSLLNTRETYSSGQDGSAFEIDPTTTSIGGKTACNPRAITVLAVPRFPEMAMPPISRSIAPSKRAVLIASWRTVDDRHNNKSLTINYYTDTDEKNGNATNSNDHFKNRN